MDWTGVETEKKTVSLVSRVMTVVRLPISWTIIIIIIIIIIINIASHFHSYITLRVRFGRERKRRLNRCGMNGCDELLNNAVDAV